MKFSFSIFLVLTIFCSGGFAQSGPNSFSIAIDNKVKEVRTMPCEKKGFCIYTETKTRKVHQITLAHCDTLLKLRWDTIMEIPLEWQQQFLFYENGALVMLFRVNERSNFTDKGVLMIYLLDKQKFEMRDISGLPTIAGTGDCHHYGGNLLFSTMEKKGDRIWYLPAGATQPIPFSFTQENAGNVLCTSVDTSQGNAVICFTSGGRTMYFETDFQGKSSFANILNEPATHAQWISIGPNHSMLMLYYEDDETFYIHPVNILNRKVLPSKTIYCADIATPKTLPPNVQEKKLIIVAPYNYITFYPTYANCYNGRITCVTELFYPEYGNYFNGWYVDRRFDGYRYDRADVHFFDTNGVFLTNVTFPYNEGLSLHSNILKKLKINGLPNGDFLLYYMYAREFNTLLLDNNCQVKDPIRSTNIQLPVYDNRRYNPSTLLFWYGNRFLLSAYQMKPGGQQKTGYTVCPLEYR